MLNFTVLGGTTSSYVSGFKCKDGTPGALFSIDYHAGHKVCSIQIVAYGNLATIAQKYITRDTRVVVSGMLNLQRMTDGKDDFQVIANDLQFGNLKNALPSPPKREPYQESPFDVVEPQSENSPASPRRSETGWNSF